MKKTAVALLTLALTLQATADVHLLPTGEFVGRDGRPGKGLTWKLSDAQGRALAARLNARHASVQFNLDYEHQAMLAEQNGQPAPASGWASTFEWRDGLGLFALNVQWTARAKEMIEAGEYKYISPVIAYDKSTGQVVDVLNASLVNIPNLDLNPVAQESVARLNASFSTHHQPEQSMNEVLKALLKALGLPETDAVTAEQAVSAVAALKAGAEGVPPTVAKALGLAETATAAEAATAAAALKASSEQAATEIAALKASGGGEPDPTKFVPLAKFNELHAEVAALRADGVDRQVEELLAGARAEGKCSAVVEDVWRSVGKKDIAQLKALIDKTPGNPVLAGLSQTAGKKVSQRDPKAEPTADELAMCRNMGLTIDQFRAGAEASA